MNLLILGGPRFLGRHLVAAARAAGHHVTMFNRGRTDPDAFPEVEKLRGDRARDLSALDGRTWDAVVDTSGYLPDVVRRGVEHLSARVGHYHFVSSISVHADFSTPAMTEEAPVATLTPEQRESVASIDAGEPMKSPVFLELYGPLKAECERVVRETFGDRAAISRPGLIIGPHDYMDRFPYWVARIAEGGQVLAPGRPERPVQVIDARDLAEWIVRGAESGLSGTFTATGPEQPLTMEGLLDACRIAAASDARFTWIDEEFLAQHAIAPWEEMPMWLPERTSTTHIGILRMDVRRAVASGLRFRPILDSARDVLAWERTRGTHTWRAGLAREKERTLLEAWREAAANRSAPLR